MHMSQSLFAHRKIVQSDPERGWCICNTEQALLPYMALCKVRNFCYSYALPNIHYPFNFSYISHLSFITGNRFLIPCQSEQFEVNRVMSVMKRLSSLQKLSI